MTRIVNNWEFLLNTQTDLNCFNCIVLGVCIAGLFFGLIIAHGAWGILK